MDVLILAGGNTSPELREATGIESRAQLPFRGRAMVDWVLDAVKHLGPVVFVGEPLGWEGEGEIRVVPAGKSFVESLGNGLKAVQSESFLLVTADLPFLTREAVDDFITRCDPTQLFNYPIIRMTDANAKFPQFKRTAMKLKEDEFTGGNILLVKTDLMKQILPRLDEAYANRKSPLKLGRMVGLGTLGRMLLGKLFPATLPIQALEKAVGGILGGPVKGIITPYAEIGTDIDSPEQYLELKNLK